jgi:formiminoglutamase
MHWESRYAPPNPSLWQGSADSCFHQYVECVNLLDQQAEKTSPLCFGLIGFKCDEGMQRDLGRSGASEAPTAIRCELAKLPMQNMLIQCYDFGNVICDDHDLEASQEALAAIIAQLLKQQIRPIVIGGGQEVAWGQYQGIAKTYLPQKKLGILNFNAHFNMQSTTARSQGSASTVFYQIAEAQKAKKSHSDYNCLGIQHTANIRQSFEIAKHYNTNFILADEVHQGLQEKCCDFIDRIIDENDLMYLSLSLEVFSPAYAPGVNAIQALGLNPWHVIPLLRQAAASAKAITYDVCGCIPRYDIDHRSAKLAAALIYEIIHHHHEAADLF